MTLTLEEVRELIKHLEHAPESQVYPMRALELARLAEERLLLEQMASLHIVRPDDENPLWLITTSSDTEAETLGEAIRQAAGVSASLPGPRPWEPDENGEL